MSEGKKKKSRYLVPTMFDIKLLNFMFLIFVNVMDPFHLIRRFIWRPSMNTLSRLYEEYKAKTLVKLDESQSLVLRLFVISTIGALLFFCAILLYILFHLMYMPTSAHVKPVHMQYNKMCDTEDCDLKTLTSPYHSFPVAHLQLNRNQLMMVGQPYHINVRVEVPETPRNKDLGVFMVCVDMKDKDNMLKSHACRSTMLRYTSPWLQILKTLFYIPFYIFGFREEMQSLNIEVFSKYVDTANSVTDIYVEIQSRVVEFYSVSLHITAHFTGVRFIIFNFPIVSAVIGIAMIFSGLVLVTLLLWYHYDYEMDWIDQARSNLIGGKSTKKFDREESSSISTTDDISMLEYNSDKLRLEDDFMYDTSDGEKKPSEE